MRLFLVLTILLVMACGELPPPIDHFPNPEDEEENPYGEINRA